MKIIIRTMKEIAEYLWVTVEHVSRVRRGKKNFSKKAQKKLKDFYILKKKEIEGIKFY